MFSLLRELITFTGLGYATNKEKLKNKSLGFNVELVSWEGRQGRLGHWYDTLNNIFNRYLLIMQVV